MRKDHFIAIAVMVVLYTTLLFAYTYDFDVTIPPDTGESPTRGAERIREMKLAIQERQNADHYWALTGNEVNDVNSGQHRQITFHSPISKPTEVVNKAFLYTKDVNSVVELFWLDEEGNERQLTSEGAVYLISSDIVGKLANDTWFTAVDSNGTSTANLIKATAKNTPEIAADANLPTGTVIDSNSPEMRIVHKKYVDDSMYAVGARTLLATVTTTTSGTNADVKPNEALTDGEFICFAEWTAGDIDAVATAVGYVDDVKLGAAQLDYFYGKDKYASFSIIVKKGCTYKANWIAQDGTAQATRKYYWTPLGN